MIQSNDSERIYQDLCRRAAAQFGDNRVVEPRSYPRIAAKRIFDVDNVEIHPDLDPLNQESSGPVSANGKRNAARAPLSTRFNHA